MTIRVAGPVLLPDTPDCDYPQGEELLSDDKIDYLIKSFKEYQFIDYEHHFTNPDATYFLRNMGKPIRIFTIDEDLTFTDVADTQITVPKGTAWLDCEIDDYVAEQEINDKLLVAFSVTVAEKDDADYFKQVYQSIPGSSCKNDIRAVHERITQKRTLIKDIQNPAMLTVSLVKFPCVYKARFCKRSIQKTDNDNKIIEAEKMDEANKTFLNNITESIKELRNSRKADNENNNTEEETTKTEETQTTEGGTSNSENVTAVDVDKMIDDKLDDFKEDVEKTIDDKLADFKTELTEEQSANKTEILEAIKGLKETDNDETVNETEDGKEDKTIENDEETDEDKEPSVKTHHDGGLSRKAKQTINKRKTAQPSRKTTLKHEGGQNSMSKIHERDIIQNAIKGDGAAVKTALKENKQIIYNTKEYNLVPYYQHKGVLNGLNKAGKHVFQESFSEEETNKAILSTELFAQYVREMLTPENIFEYANYMTVYGEEAPIRRVKAAKSYTSQDGHLPANYYFDNIPEAAELKHEKDVIRPVTQRDLFTISDRQLRNNVFGDDLLDVSLATVKETFYNGVYAARILGDTAKEGSSYTDAEGETQDIDKQFTRKDGFIKQAGVQLVSGTDFDVDNILDIFDTMYYSLPEYAQDESNYAFFVPSQIRRAFYNHFIKNSRESKIDLVSETRDLYFNNIPILTSKTLNNAEFRNMLTGGDAKILLTNPQNTILGVGRGFGIEPERHADTSSTYYYLTLDTDAKYAKPEEAVVATIAKDDYATLPVTTEP